MHQFSEDACLILDRMEPGRRYQPQDLCALVPHVSREYLGEIMHELWINRQVERIGYAGWQRRRSAPPHPPDPVSREVEIVKPEDLFDHDSFADFFK